MFVYKKTYATGHCKAARPILSVRLIIILTAFKSLQGMHCLAYEAFYGP